MSFVVISKAALQALTDPVTVMDLERASVEIDLGELADADPSAVIQDVKERLRDRPIGEQCPFCGTQLTVSGADGMSYRFTGHTDEYCRMAARHRYSNIISHLRRELIEHERMRRAFAALLKQERDAEEMFGRASMALDRAGVPNDVGCNDPLEQLAARIRWRADNATAAQASAMLGRVGLLLEFAKRQIAKAEEEEDRVGKAGAHDHLVRDRAFRVVIHILDGHELGGLEDML